jgi:hypothetical protein
MDTGVSVFLTGGRGAMSFECYLFDLVERQTNLIFRQNSFFADFAVHLNAWKNEMYGCLYGFNAPPLHFARDR